MEGLKPKKWISSWYAFQILRFIPCTTQRGSRRCPPLGCLPLWGKEGVTLLKSIQNTPEK
jgi:hypothetical protein